MNKKALTYIIYGLVAVIITISIMAIIYPYNYIKRNNASDIDYVKFYYSPNDTDIFFKNKNYVSDYVTTYSRFISFLDSFKTLLSDEEDKNYAINEKAVQNLQFAFPSYYFEEDSILIYCMHGNEGRNVETSLINVEVKDKIAHILCDIKDVGVGETGKYDYVMYIIPIQGKELVSTKIEFPGLETKDILKIQLFGLSFTLYISFALNYVITKKQLNKNKTIQNYANKSAKNKNIFLKGMSFTTIYCVITIILLFIL